MKHIIKLISQTIVRPRHDGVKLGRWNFDYNNIDRKIYLSNEDHCGPCEQYNNNNNNKNNDKKIIPKS